MYLIVEQDERLDRRVKQSSSSLTTFILPRENGRHATATTDNDGGGDIDHFIMT
jgi:hypothetical protein